jgi:uncharacterized protein YbjT (DUF2867 family)
MAWSINMIIDRLRALAERLRGQVPDGIVDLYEGDVDAGEPQLAVEELFDALVEDDLTISADLADEIQAVADELRITRFTPAELRALIRSQRPFPFA